MMENSFEFPSEVIFNAGGMIRLLSPAAIKNLDVFQGVGIKIAASFTTTPLLIKQKEC